MSKLFTYEHPDLGELPMRFRSWYGFDISDEYIKQFIENHGGILV